MITINLDRPYVGIDRRSGYATIVVSYNSYRDLKVGDEVSILVDNTTEPMPLNFRIENMFVFNRINFGGDQLITLAVKGALGFDEDWIKENYFRNEYNFIILGLRYVYYIN